MIKVQINEGKIYFTTFKKFNKIYVAGINEIQCISDFAAIKWQVKGIDGIVTTSHSF